MARHNIPSSVGGNRRRFLKVGAGGGLLWLAGCLGDDDVDDDEADADLTDDDDDVDDDVADDDLPDDDDDVDDEILEADDGEAGLEIHDVTAHVVRELPLPADSQYNPYSSAPFPGHPFASEAALIERSTADLQYYGDMVADWDYQPGILEFTLHDDFYWWSGKQVDIDDYLINEEFADFLWGGDDLDAHPNIVSFEKVDDLTARLALTDSWHEPWAISQTIAGSSIGASRNFHQAWLEQFQDAPTLEEVDSIRTDIDETQYADDEQLEKISYMPYEFRLDEDGYGDVGEGYWEFELVREKDGNLRHYANPENGDRLPNYRRWRYTAVEEIPRATPKRSETKNSRFLTRILDGMPLTRPGTSPQNYGSSSALHSTNGVFSSTSTPIPRTTSIFDGPGPT